MIAAIEQRDAYVGVAKGSRGGQTTESAADDYDVGTHDTGLAAPGFGLSGWFNVLRASGRAESLKPKASYAHLNPCFEIGSDRMRLPVAAKIAFASAGIVGGSAGSPRPVGGLSVTTKWTSTSGA